ncbi:MAG: hypothetical protein WD048_01845 [Chitinophagales bacterium]
MKQDFTFTKRYYLAELTISILTVLVCLIFFPITFDDSYDSLIYNAASLQFSNYSIIDWHYLFLVGINEPLKFLFNIFPAINWLVISYVLFCWLSLFVALILVKKVIFDKHQGYVLLIWTQILISLIFMESFISLTYTRTALLLCGVSMFGFFFSPKITFKQASVYTIIFISGMCFRPEAAIGMLLLISVGHFIYFTSFKRLIKRSFIPTFIILLVATVFIIDWNHTDRFEKKIEPNIEYILSTGRVVPISEMENKVDSVKYRMATRGMFIDSETLSADFIRDKIATPEYNFKLDKLIRSFTNIYGFYKYYLFIPAVLIILIVLSLISDNRLKTFTSIVLFNVFNFLLLSIIDYKAEIYLRHFLCFQIFTLLICLFYLFRSEIKNSKHTLITAVLSIILIVPAFGYTIKNYIENYSSVAEAIDCYKSTMHKIEENFQNRYLLVSLEAYHLFDKPPSIKNKNYTKNTYLMYDLSTYSIVPSYVRYLSTICNCKAENPVLFLNWAADNQVLYIGNTNRVEILEQFMKVIYDIEVSFTPISSKKNKHECMKPSVSNNSIAGSDFEIFQIDLR